ncbi:MAG: hypothetical protein QOD11_1988 [Bradyrhizobium sp.]|jgi:hypothetical protein|nr:hypothetical protein [Bradyrhizobium sp.]
MSTQSHTPQIFKRVVSRFAVPLRKGPQVYPHLATLYDRVAVICHGDIDDLHRFRFPPKRLNLSECPPIYLKPVEDEGMVPILRLAYDLTNPNRPKVALRVVLVKMHSESLCAIGYRFEAGAGTHAYFHCQLIRGFEKADNFGPAMPHWTPESQPAFCLDASRPAHLLAACFISLYGLTEWQRQTSADTFLIKALKQSLAGMHLHS